MSNSMIDTPVPTYIESPPFRTIFASLSIQVNDRIRFLSFPPSAIDACRDRLTSTWPRIIQEERLLDTSHEMKLLGSPWRDDSLKPARLVSALLSTLHQLGWVLTLSANLSKIKDSRDALVFRHQDPPPAPCDWCAITFSSDDRLRLIDAPSGLIEFLAARFSPKFAVMQKPYAPGVEEMKIVGHPWVSQNRSPTALGKILLILVASLEEEGWSVYGSVTHKTAPARADRSSCDIWHLCRPLGWVKGTPVFHR